MRQERRHSTISARRPSPGCRPLQYEFHTLDDHIDTAPAQLPPVALLQGLVAHTTSHGVPHIDNAKGAIKKAIWSVITFVMVACLIANLVLIITNYLKFKVDIIIQMQHQRELNFPAVSLCNMNPVRSSMVAAVPDIENLIYGNTYNESMEGQPVKGSAYSERKYPRLSFLKEEKLAELLAGLNSTWQIGIGHQAVDTILDCQFAGYKCYYQEFDHYYNTILGNCFVFNSGWGNATIWRSVKTGRRYGLKMILNINQAEYLPHLSDAAGIRVVIHPQTRMPFPQDEGVVVAPGVLTSIGVTQLTINRRGDQYGNCTDVNMWTKNLTRNVFEEYYDVRYSTTACYKTCYQRNLIQNCGCGDPQFPLEGKAIGEGSYHVCNSHDSVEDDCKYNTSNYFNNAFIPCDECVRPCDETTYSPEISSVQWPSNVYEESIQQQYNETLAKIDDDLPLNDSEKLKRNFLKVEVFFEEFNYEYISERPSYTEGQFASDIGGVLGLWLGWSIMSVFEFVELLIDFIVLLCFKLKAKMCLGDTNATKKALEADKSSARNSADLRRRNASVTPSGVYPECEPIHHSLKFV